MGKFPDTRPYFMESSEGFGEPEKLYSLDGLNGLNEQPLPQKEAMDDDSVFGYGTEGIAEHNNELRQR
jgi:hypothetical protein